jgi:hypothetical protein
LHLGLFFQRCPDQHAGFERCGTGMSEWTVPMIAASELLTSPEFWLGGALLAFFQIGKFGEINTVGADLKDQPAVIPNLRTRDFIGNQVYLGFLTIFILVTITAYFFVCLASPALISGWVRVTQGVAEDTRLMEFVKSVPYPLFIAAAFMGLANQSVPGFSSIVNIQRNVFHELVGVPGVVVSASTFMSMQILAQESTKEALQKRLVELASNAWMAKISRYADENFYHHELGRLKLDPATFADSSQRELEYLVSALVYVAAIATAKESGRTALATLAKDLRVEPPTVGGTPWAGVPAAMLWLIMSITVLWFLLPMLHPLIQAIMGSTPAKFWPSGQDALNYSGSYILSQVLPVLLATLLLLVTLPTKEDADGEPELTAKQLFDAKAGLLLLAAIVVVLFDFLQTLSDYGLNTDASAGDTQWDSFLGFVLYWLPYMALHSMIAVSISFVIILYIARRTGELSRSTPYYVWGLVTAIAIITATFYAGARMSFQYKIPWAFDYVLLIVLLNTAAAAISLLIARAICRRRFERARQAIELVEKAKSVVSAKIVPLEKAAAERH